MKPAMLAVSARPSEDGAEMVAASPGSGDPLRADQAAGYRRATEVSSQFFIAIAGRAVSKSLTALTLAVVAASS